MLRCCCGGVILLVFTCLLDQVSRYLTEGLERAREGLTEAAALWERFVLETNITRRVAAASASAAEAAAAAGESNFRSFMVAVQRCASSVALVQQYFAIRYLGFCCLLMGHMLHLVKRWPTQCLKQNLLLIEDYSKSAMH